MAALELADSSNDVGLVERTDALGGNLARVDLTAPHLDSARDLGDSEEVRLDLDRQDFLAQGGTVQGGDDPKRDRFIERATEEARYAEERERAMDAYLREAEAARTGPSTAPPRSPRR